MVAEYHQKVRNGEIPSVEERKMADAICANINPNISSNMSLIQQNHDIDTMEIEQQRTMNEYIYNQLDDDQIELVGNCTKLWDRTEVLRCFFDTLGFKSIIGLPVIYGRRNKLKYEPWYAIKIMADSLGRRVDNLQTQLLKSFEFLKMEQLKKKIQHPQFKGVENELVIPQHLKDNKMNERLYVNHKAILTLVRDIAYKNNPVLVKDKDVRDYAKNLINTLDSLDDNIGMLIDDLSSIVSEYRYNDQLRQIEERDKQQKEIEQQQKEEQERIRVARIDLAIASFPNRPLSKTHKVYIFSSPEYLDKMVPHVKIGITDDLTKRLKQHQTSCPTGLMYYDVDTYDSKGAEQALLNMYRSYGLSIKDKNSSAEEWIRISSLERTKERLKLVAENRNGEYEDLSDECRLIREMMVGEQEPFIVDGQNYIEYKEPEPEPDIEIPKKEYVQKICEKIGINDNKAITYKTALINTMRAVKKQDEFKSVKTKLPIDIDSFLDMKIEGISIKKEERGKQVKITIEIQEI